MRPGQRSVSGTSLVIAGCACALWVLLVSSSINTHEMLVGGVSVLATVALMLRVIQTMKDVLGSARAANLFRVCGFDTSKRDPVRIARTVLAVSYTTVAPNFIVIGIDYDQSRMLFHQLERSEVPRMTRSLGAKG